MLKWRQWLENVCSDKAHWVFAVTAASCTMRLYPTIRSGRPATAHLRHLVATRWTTSVSIVTSQFHGRPIAVGLARHVTYDVITDTVTGGATSGRRWLVDSNFGVELQRGGTQVSARPRRTGQDNSYLAVKSTNHRTARKWPATGARVSHLSHAAGLSSPIWTTRPWRCI